jgi:uncharacterized membrane protein
MSSLYPTVATVLSILSLDAVWLRVNRPRYNRLVGAVQGSGMRLRWVPALVAYALMVVSIRHIILPWAAVRCAFFQVTGGRNDSAKVDGRCMLFVATAAALVGLCVYGIFNATNMAIFTGYDGVTAVLDTLWGCVLFTTTAVLVWWLAAKFGWKV